VSVPDATSSVLGIAGDLFGVCLAIFTIIFISLFLLADVGKLRRSLASVLAPGDEERWCVCGTARPRRSLDGRSVWS
jgi:predicted PurR-regulated permease PerM